jgi:hypothetical protein
MRLALETLRGRPCPARDVNYLGLGLMKYGLACGAALVSAGAVWAVSAVWLSPFVALLVFYAVEAQMAFLFPLALDGEAQPFAAAWRMTGRAGGTPAVMRVVLPLAGVMLLGGLAGRGFLRSWCLGCLAVCVWYEDLRTSPPPLGNAWFPFELGCCRPLLVRPESVHLGLVEPLRLLYVSDLHLGRAWTRPLPDQLLTAARAAAPDLILLGGDLADHRRGLPTLLACVRDLATIAPVLAVPGNHDRRAGVAAVRRAVVSGGGVWLSDRSATTGTVRIDGKLDEGRRGEIRVLCTHYPHEFPAASRAGYRLILAGHLHGGQCVLATRHGRLYPAAWVNRWHGLRFSLGDAVMLVSRGAADTLPLRFNCPREVILCTLT